MLPRFTVALPQDALLQSTPPFDFPGVSMRVFPLRADMTRVQSLVDGWINAMLPPEIAYYRVFAPYVTLVALNYGRAAVIPSNLGWSSQKELTFSIPVQWYRRTRRGFELQDFAVLTPFIFVDNDLSIPAGREVFGWQKNLIWMDPLGDRWLSNPRAPMKHAGISTRAFREVYAGKQEQPMPFVAIDEAASGASLQYPPDRQNPLLPWVALANAMDAAGGLAQDMVELLTGLGLIRRRRVPLRDGRTALLDPGGSPGAALRTLLRSIDPGDPDLYANEINVKQFRDAEHPTTACYQDVNNTVMRIQEVNRLGILGETRVLLGDITGGYRITLHQWESLPVADMLGLEAARSTEVDGATIVSLKPVLPMWADMDLLYAEERHVIAWRSKDHPWTPGPGVVAPARQRDAPRDKPNNQHSIAANGAPSPKPKKIPYNTTLGSSSPVIYGPFETPKATLRVLPLLASERRLGELVDRALNEPLRGGVGEGDTAPGGSGYSFSPWGRYVYLVVTTADETYSVDNNIGSWPSRSVRFLVPVRRFVDGQPDGFALYCPFAFSGSTLDSVSSSEINGMAVMGARIDSPSSTWLEEGGPAVGRGKDLAVLRAMIPPILDAGERARTRTILRVSQRGTDRPDLDEEALNPHWAPRIKRDLERRRGAVPKVPGALHHRPGAGGGDGSWTTASDLDLARAHAVDLLGDQGPIPFVMLKQFRDVARPDRACYRALIEVEQRLVHVERIEEITGPLEVTIFDYESMPIARVLGLVHRSSGYHEGLRCRKMEPVRPFWVTAMIREELGKNLAEQRRDLSWVRPTSAAPPEPVAPERVAAPGAWSEAERLANLSMLDLGNPRHIGRLLTAARGKQSAAGMSQPDDRIQATTETTATAAGTSPSEAAAATRAIGAVEPQWIMESLLSREWESRSSPVWLHHKREIERAAAEARGGVKALTEQALGEIKELVAQRRKVTANTHHDILEVIDSHLLPRYVALAWISAEARHLNELAFAHRTAPAGAAERYPAASGFAAGAAVMHDVLHFADDGPPDSPPPPPAAEPPPKVGELYDQSEFDELENEEPEILRLAEGVLGRDVAVGGLIKTILDLCGSAAGRVIGGYSAHPPPASSGTVAGSPQDLFLHFAGGDEEPGTPANEALPDGLVDDLSKGATATLAKARSLVYLAWKTAAEEPDGKHAKWVSFVGDAGREVEAAREALILALAKCWQKPFFCVRRDTAGPDEIQDELFPRGRCWSDRNGVPWYSPTEE